MKNKTGTSMSKVINVKNERKKLKTLEANCKKCLYFPKGKCKFNLSPRNGKCFKFERFIAPKGQSKNPQIICKICLELVSWDRKRKSFRAHLLEKHNISYEDYDKVYRY